MRTLATIIERKMRREWLLYLLGMRRTKEVREKNLENNDDTESNFNVFEHKQKFNEQNDCAAFACSFIRERVYARVQFLFGWQWLGNCYNHHIIIHFCLNTAVDIENV